jgi:ribosomal protein L29
MKTAEINAMTDEQLVHKGLQLERDLIAARFSLKTNQLTDTSVVSKFRKDMARLNGAIRTREIDAGSGRNAMQALHGKTFQAVDSAAEGGEGAGFLKGIVDKISSNE